MTMHFRQRTAEPFALQKLNYAKLLHTVGIFLKAYLLNITNVLQF